MYYIIDMTKYLNEIVGQEAVKTRLAIYKDSYKTNGILPFLCFVGGRGAGKTKLIREFRKTLVREDGSRPPVLEVNCASIKSMGAFFEQIYDKWVDNGAVLFADELHNLPIKLQEIFLTVLDKDPNPVRRVMIDFGDGMEEYLFDFTQISFIGATTDHQKLCGPLDDRLTTISLAPYNSEELLQIFKYNLTGVEICNKTIPLIKDVFRGHPRHCVEIAEDLQKYSAAKSLSKITEDSWHEFCKIMGIHAHGFNEAEIHIVRVLGEKGNEASLEAIAASTGYSKSVIRTRYEHALLSRGILEISGKRILTRTGREFYKKIKETV